jgi:hypothetical protein
MSTTHDARLIRLALSIVVDLRVAGPHSSGVTDEMQDLLVDVAPDATVGDLIQALVGYLQLRENVRYGLLRQVVSWQPRQVDTAAFGYLPLDLLLSECGLFDGVTLRLCDRVARPAPDLFIDVQRSPTDLFLIDERGTHRGRVTRLPQGVEIVAGTAPQGGRVLVVDDQQLPETVMRLVNREGSHVVCTVAAPDGVYVSGTPVFEGDEQMLLPGGTISLRRDDTDYVSFTLTTLAGLNYRSPIGKIRFDPAARLAALWSRRHCQLRRIVRLPPEVTEA